MVCSAIIDPRTSSSPLRRLDRYPTHSTSVKDVVVDNVVLAAAARIDSEPSETAWFGHSQVAS